jgi:putative transposase
MTQGLVRYQQTGNLHFITFSCYQRRRYLRTSPARSLFERALERTRQKYSFYIVGYVVMPEHVHLLISEPPNISLGEAIKAIKLSVALRRKERPFWSPRYYDFNVFTEKKRIEKLRYTHRNPVTRGLVSTPEDWPWSSFLHYATGIEGTVEIESPWTATRRNRATQASHVRESGRGAPTLLE